MTSDSGAVRARHALAEQAGAERLVGAAQLGALELDRPHGRLDGGGRLPAVAAAGSVPCVLVVTLVAAAAEELGHQGLDRSLHDQADAQAGDVLEHGRQVTLRREQLVDLGAEALGGGYSR